MSLGNIDVMAKMTARMAKTRMRFSVNAIHVNLMSLCVIMASVYNHLGPATSTMTVMMVLMNTTSVVSGSSSGVVEETLFAILLKQSSIQSLRSTSRVFYYFRVPTVRFGFGLPVRKPALHIKSFCMRWCSWLLYKPFWLWSTLRWPQRWTELSSHHMWYW